MRFKIIPEPYTYYKKNEGNILFYNTLDGKFIISKDTKILSFFENLIRNNMIYEEELDQEEENFIRKLKDLFMIGIIEIKEGQKGSIAYENEIIINDFKKIETHGRIHCVKYVKSVNMHINSQCKHNCFYCSTASKQIKMCFKSDLERMDLPTLQRILKQLLKPTEINLLGGDILQHPELMQMLQHLKSSGYPNSVLHINANTLNDKNMDLIKQLKDLVRINIHCEHGNIPFISRYLKTVSHKNIMLTFIISSMKEYEEIRNYSDEHFPEQHEFHILYHQNQEFFEENVFIDRDDLFSEENSMVDIMTSKLINTGFFGKMTILSNGDVYLNLNFQTVGNIHDTTIHNIIETELKNKSVWFMQRSGVQPCAGCIFNELCPSISNYELAMGKYNLCHYNPGISKWREEEGYVLI